MRNNPLKDHKITIIGQSFVLTQLKFGSGTVYSSSSSSSSLVVDGNTLRFENDNRLLVGSISTRIRRRSGRSVLMVARTDSDWHGDSLVVVVVVGTYMESYGMVVGLLLPKLLLLLMRGCGHHDLMIVLLLKTEK